MKRIIPLIIFQLFITTNLLSQVENLNVEYEKARKESNQERISEIIKKAEENPNQMNINLLIKILKEDEDSINRASAAISLGNLKNSKIIVDALIYAFLNDDNRVREATITSLYKMVEQGAQGANASLVPIFERAVNDQKNENIRKYGILGLSKVAQSKHYKFFLEGLKSEDVVVKLASIEALGTIGAQREWGQIQPFCNSTDSRLVVACINVAGKFKTGYALLEIEKKISDPDPEISSAAINALSQFQGSSVIQNLVRLKYQDPNNQHIDLINKILKSKNAYKKYAYIKAPLNLRNLPNENASVVKVLAQGSIVEVLDREKKRYELETNNTLVSDFWYKVKDFDNKIGYVFGYYIDVIDL